MLRHLVILYAAAISPALMPECSAEERSFALVFGPAPEAQSSPAANAIAPRVYEWLQVPKTELELRRPGIRVGQELVKFTKPDAVAQAVADAAKSGRETDAQRFLDSLDLTVYSLGRRPGARYLVAVLDPPALSDDQSNRVQQTLDTCKQRQIKVLLLDLSAPGSKTAAIWKSLAESTGGAFVRDLPELEARLPNRVPAPEAAPRSEPVVAAATPAGPIVYTRFFRTAPASAKGSGSTLASMRGLLIAESPMRSLQFDPQGGNQSARVRVTLAVRNRNSETVWQARKEMTVKSSASKLDARKAGSLFYLREVQLPAGDYVAEATVEDLSAAKSSTAREPLTAIDSLPGLAASGALFVRKLAKSADVIEGDQVLQYEGEALAPVLNPAFPANTPFELPVYFLFYPDVNGKRPQLRLDILSKGQVVGGTALAFSDTLRDDARSGGGIAGEQKHEFPYLAKLADAMFNAGEYEVWIIIRQDRNELTRSLPFRVGDVR